MDPGAIQAASICLVISSCWLTSEMLEMCLQPFHKQTVRRSAIIIVLRVFPPTLT
jgi:hypothetical protein